MADAPKLPSYLGANVRRLRRARGWTQDDLAEHTGMTYRRVQMIEAGTVNATLKTLERLAVSLQVEGSELLRRASLVPRKPGRPSALEEE